MHRLLTLSPARTLRGDRRGAVGLTFALILTCSLAFIGTAVDLTRTFDRRVALQTAVDHAALAGASAYTDSTQGATAYQAARAYITAETSNGAGYLTFSGVTNIVAVPGVLSNGQSSYNVTVSVTATLATTFMVLWTPSTTISASATAANPIVKPTFSIGQFGASAADDNTAFAYPVPMSGGKPQYNKVPPQSQFFQVGRNNPDFPTPTGQSFPSIAATQPIAFALQNITGGQNGYGANASNCNNPNSNQYGAISGPGNDSGISGTGQANWFYSSFLMLGESPAQITNYNYSYTGYMASGAKCIGPQTIHSSTNYPTNSNCSFIMAQYTPGTALATPPTSGSCFSPTATPGVATAALSCQQFGSNTYAIWWNDMGGYSDDRDYNDAYFTVSCNTLTPTGATALTQVVLIK